jgi:hypothetical protein
MKSRKDKKNKVYTIKEGILGTGLYAGVVIIDTSEIEDEADYGGMRYELKKLGIRDGEEYQIDNADDLIMSHEAYERCKHILKKFGAKAVNL